MTNEYDPKLRERGDTDREIAHRRPEATRVKIPPPGRRPYSPNC